MKDPKEYTELVRSLMLGEARVPTPDEEKRNARADKKQGEAAIREWKRQMKAVEDHIKFLQDKRLGEMQKKLDKAEAEAKKGNYRYAAMELYFNGDLY
jgi:predicted S18 family serine protease